MTTDLWMLVASVGLTWALIMADTTYAIVANGMGWASGNRDETPEKTGTHGRIHRCSLNMQENLPLFAALVLVAAASGEADSTSALGAQVFFGARLVHAGIYIAGIPTVRTGFWAVSVVGMGMVVASLFG